MDKFLNLPLKIPRRSPTAVVFFVRLPNGIQIQKTAGLRLCVSWFAFGLRPYQAALPKKTVILSIGCDTCIEWVVTSFYAILPDVPVVR